MGASGNVTTPKPSDDGTCFGSAGFRLASGERLSKTPQILREHANAAATRAVNIPDEKERDT